MTRYGTESTAREYSAGDYCVEFPVWEGRNPIVPGWYADSEGAYFEDQYWVYPTLSLLYGDDLVTYADDLHRTTDAINPDYNIQTHMDAFSSPDLVTWTKHPAVLSIKEQVFRYFSTKNRQSCVSLPIALDRNTL